MNDAPEMRKPPTTAQRAWLRLGLGQPGGKLPLFDFQGQEVDRRTIRACIEAGWAEPWFANPLKPDWLVCKLTQRGRDLAGRPKRTPAPPRPPSIRIWPANVTPIR
jgi:hypothetical protein